MIQLNKKLILASGSPRRKEILHSAGFDFEVKVKEVNEVYPMDMPIKDIPVYLSKLKAEAQKVEEDQILLTADTIVLLENQVLGKPEDAEHAKEMLNQLSGKKHTVITGVCIKTSNEVLTLSDTSFVQFKKLEAFEIDYYIKTAHPYDKAGSYGIQDWIGLTAIEKIEGSFYTIMGLPIHLVYKEMLKLCQFTLN